jgi:hypothetical protein
MTNIFLAILLAVVSFNFFTVTYKLNGINRTLLFTPTSIFEVNVPLVDFNENLDLYFDKEKLESDLTSYYDSNLIRYTSEYDISFYYLNIEDKSLCISDFCKAVEVTVNSEILFGFQYEKTMRFEIRNTTL